MIKQALRSIAEPRQPRSQLANGLTILGQPPNVRDYAILYING